MPAQNAAGDVVVDHAVNRHAIHRHASQPRIATVPIQPRTISWEALHASAPSFTLVIGLELGRETSQIQRLTFTGGGPGVLRTPLVSHEPDAAVSRVNKVTNFRGDTTAFSFGDLADQLYFDQVHPSHSVPGRRGRSSSPAPGGSEPPMLVHVPKLLTDAQVARCREVMALASWVDGRVTAGHQSARAKHNPQIPEGSAEARELGELVLGAPERTPLFVSAALPLRVFPPLFNRYEPGMTFGSHVDNAVRQVTGTPFRLRTDLSITLFLSGPEVYDGGELVVEDTYGAHSVKLPAGDLILYPATSLHRVTPVTRGARLASFFWVQSMVRDDGRRSLLFDLDMAINQVNQALPDHAGVVALTSCYHNLLHQWADA
jgi:PKHD-type hydroxylase